ncbi:protein SAR DEFICIENT 1-like [Phragmites australis]|uniref:protein SAR DEFICIENT 1-like n=1 Tax=Phragmites australis TaxID=29695 RepID=UPI002D790AE7|nr:protein SAR DEFICIENT 1-like [Phragmites australis]
MAAKRFHDGYEKDPDQPEAKRMRRLPSFSTVIREAMMQKHLQNLFRLLEPLFRRVVQEELQAGLALSPRYIEKLPQIPPVERPTWKLAFRNPPHPPIFTGSKIEDDNSNPLEVILVDMGIGSPSALPQALRIELVPLFGDFPPDDLEDWAADEFQKGIVKPREGKRPLLTGEVSLTMRDGRATVSELQFTDNSSWVRCRKFRIGVRVVPGSYNSARILEAMTKAFVVRDHRGELYRKHYPPVLGDDVWRLEKIGKGGTFHRKLAQHHVKSIQEFLRLLMVKPDELRAILGDGMTDRMWEATTSHAKTCLPGDKVYAYSGSHGTIYVNSIFNLVKVEFGGVEYPLHQLNKAEASYVQHLMREAYEHRNTLQEADAVLLHSHAANNVTLMHNAAHAAPADPTVWLPGPEVDFQADEVPVPQPNYGFQWPGQMYNMAG